MSFDLKTWQKQIIEKLPDLRSRMMIGGVNTLYYFLAAISLAPMIQAVQKGDTAALATLSGILAGSVSTNLISNIIQNFKDKSDAEITNALIDEVNKTSDLRVEIDILLEKLNTLEQAKALIAADDKNWFCKTLQEELSTLRNEIDIQGNLSNSNIIIGDSNQIVQNQIHYHQNVVLQSETTQYVARENYESEVFVSYASEGESERIVNKLEQAFCERGIQIIRDKKNLNYRGSIQEFEQRIGQGQCIILIISDKYLRSEHCMYELVKIGDNREFRKRIFPIILEDARIYKGVERLSYIQYWDNEIKQLNKAIKKIDVIADIRTITSNLDKYVRIRAQLDDLTGILSDMNALTPELHETNGFITVIEAVEHVLMNVK